MHINFLTEALAHYARLLQPHRPLAFALLVLLACASPMPTWASKWEQRPIATEIALVRPTLVKAVLYISTQRTTYNVRQRESDLPAISCEYVLTDPRSLTTLMDLLEGATFVNDSPPKMDARFGIYLHEQGGKITKIILNNPFFGEGAKGIANDQIGVVSNLTFPKDLREFASKLHQTKPNFYCDGEKGNPIELAPRPSAGHK